jgi:hypothetical protein
MNNFELYIYIQIFYILNIQTSSKSKRFSAGI